MEKNLPFVINTNCMSMYITPLFATLMNSMILCILKQKSKRKLCAQDERVIGPEDKDAKQERAETRGRIRCYSTKEEQEERSRYVPLATRQSQLVKECIAMSRYSLHKKSLVGKQCALWTNAH